MSIQSMPPSLPKEIPSLFTRLSLSLETLEVLSISVVGALAPISHAQNPSPAVTRPTESIATDVGRELASLQQRIEEVTARLADSLARLEV